MVRKNPSTGSSRGFASAWARLPEAEQKKMIGQLQAAMLNAFGSLRDTAGPVTEDEDATSPNHAPYRGQHKHSHPAFGHHSGDQGGQHEHHHSHGRNVDGKMTADNNHHHEHADEDAFTPSPPTPDAQPVGRYSKHIRFQRGQVVVMNQARSLGVDLAFARAFEAIAELERGR